MNALVSAQSVSKSYARVQAVRDLSFEIQRGEIFALLGPNGAGKTSMVRILVGITRPDSGHVVFRMNGQETTSPDKQLLGYLPEERGFYRETPVLRTLVYFAVLRGMAHEDARKAALEWLERFELTKRAGDKLETLSKGNQQKVQFISSILHKPAFAILDEPFSGLDPINQEMFVQFIRELRDQGTTILLSAHQMNLVEKLADRMFLIHQGREVLSGALDDIRKSSESGQKVLLRVHGEVDPACLPQHADIQRLERTEDGSLAIWVREEASLSPVLSALSRELEIASVHSERISLHEIFVDAVSGHVTKEREGELVNEL